MTKENITKEKYNTFLGAIDTVCGECIRCGEETCTFCPVRETTDHINETAKEAGVR